MVIEGIIDLLYQDTDGQLVILDYKSDQVLNEADVRERLNHYRMQGAVYAAAVERATGMTGESNAVLVRPFGGRTEGSGESAGSDGQYLRRNRQYKQPDAPGQLSKLRARACPVLLDGVREMISAFSGTWELSTLDLLRCRGVVGLSQPKHLFKALC